MSNNQSNEQKEQKLSTESYKGVRDFYPPDMAIQEYIFSIWRKVVESYGYEEYGSSIFEPAELYRNKTSEEIINQQTYTFTDRGQREITLRPEITPSVARMVAAKRRELTFPLRWYSIPNLYRYEQPQRGRLREFWQLNVDLFGVNSVEADIEIIAIAYKIMKAFGAKDDDFTIKISSRKWLEWLSLELGNADKTSENKRLLFQLLDMKDKNPDKYREGLKEIDPDLTPEIVSGKSINWETAGENLGMRSKILLEKLQKLGVKNATIDMTGVVRGFDYYTDTVFEIFDTNPKNRRALFGGGRYDDLTSLFGGDKIPAVGFGMGDVTMRDFLETRNLLPKIKAPADYYICVMSSEQASFAAEVADNLRSNGSRVAIDYSYKKIGDQIKNADKRDIPQVIVIGEEEVKRGKLKVKVLATGEENEIILK